MGLVNIFISAAVSIVVSLATAFILRFLDRKTVEWLIVGTASRVLPQFDEPTRLRFKMELWNTGDAPAWNVRLIRCNKEGLETWETLESGCIEAGRAIQFEMLPEEAWSEETWVQVIFQTSPVYRQKQRTSKRVYLRPLVHHIGEYENDQPYAAVDGRGRIPKSS